MNSVCVDVLLPFTSCLDPTWRGFRCCNSTPPRCVRWRRKMYLFVWIYPNCGKSSSTFLLQWMCHLYIYIYLYICYCSVHNGCWLQLLWRGLELLFLFLTPYIISVWSVLLHGRWMMHVVLGDLWCHECKITCNRFVPQPDRNNVTWHEVYAFNHYVLYEYMYVYICIYLCVYVYLCLYR